MKKLKTIKLNKTTGKEIIANAEDVFEIYIDSDFKSLTQVDNPTEQINLDIFEIDKNGTFKNLFVQPEKQVMTQGQIIEFCKNYKDLLSLNYYTFFLFKDKYDLFVARVDFVGRGQLRVRVSPFSNGLIWSAGGQRRLVSPQLDSGTLASSDTLSLESFVAELKDLINKYEKRNNNKYIKKDGKRCI